MLLKHLTRSTLLNKTTTLRPQAIPARTMSTSTFHLPNTPSSVPVSHPTSITQSQLLDFPAFKTWINTLNHSLSRQTQHQDQPFHKAPYDLKSIEIQSVDFFGGNRLGFLKLKAEITNDDGEKLPGSVFMRGGSVAMLIILTSATSNTSSSNDEKEEYAILTLQPRIPAGSLSFTELPAGMIDDSGTFAGAAAKEIAEETGLEIESDELIDLTQLVSELPAPKSSKDDNQESREENLQKGIYPSPGGSDEFIPIFLARKTLPLDQINELKGKLTGLRDHGEKITLRIVKVEDVWKVAWRDGKTLAAMTLYEGLRREGRI